MEALTGSLPPVSPRVPKHPPRSHPVAPPKVERVEQPGRMQPAPEWDRVKALLPARLAGWQVLEIGCHPSFYGLELARMGARITGISNEARHLREAYHQARLSGVEEAVRFKEMLIYDLARDRKTYDLVIFAGSLCELRYPLLALDIMARRVRRFFLLQTPAAPAKEQVSRPHENLAAMLSSSGLAMIEQPSDRSYWCERTGDADSHSRATAEYLSAIGVNS